MQRRKLDDYGFFSIDTVVQSDGATNERFVSVGPTCKMSEFERFKSGSGVNVCCYWYWGCWANNENSFHCCIMYNIIVFSLHTKNKKIKQQK